MKKELAFPGQSWERLVTSEVVIFSGPQRGTSSLSQSRYAMSGCLGSPEEVLNTVSITVFLKTCFIEHLTTMYLFLTPFFLLLQLLQNWLLSYGGMAIAERVVVGSH